MKNSHKLYISYLNKKTFSKHNSLQKMKKNKIMQLLHILQVSKILTGLQVNEIHITFI